MNSKERVMEEWRQDIAMIPEYQEPPVAGAARGSADGRRVESAHRLAMLALQSARYAEDSEFAEAVDNVIAWSAPWNRLNDKLRHGGENQ